MCTLVLELGHSALKEICSDFIVVTMITGTSKDIIPEISVLGSWTLKFDFQENRSHDLVQTRPMCCTETRDVQHALSLY